MQHSIAAKYAARPAAHFVRPSARAKERRLGLRARLTFVAAGSRPTVLHRDVAPPPALHAPWRSMRTAGARPAASGLLGPNVVMQWARPVRTVGKGRASAAPAWRG